LHTLPDFLKKIPLLTDIHQMGRRFKPNMRPFGVPGKLGLPPTCWRAVSGCAEVKSNAETAEHSVIKTQISCGFCWNA
jgi:hypothetical protein